MVLTYMQTTHKLDFIIVTFLASPGKYLDTSPPQKLVARDFEEYLGQSQADRTWSLCAAQTALLANFGQLDSAEILGCCIA